MCLIMAVLRAAAATVRIAAQGLVMAAVPEAAAIPVRVPVDGEWHKFKEE